jgi:hypothetical protein
MFFQCDKTSLIFKTSFVFPFKILSAEAKSVLQSSKEPHHFYSAEALNQCGTG